MLTSPKFLVISTVGDDSLHRYWSKSERFDTCLIYYGDGKGYENESKYYIRSKGPKYHLISDAIEKYPEFKNYTYIWMPDDDVYMKRGCVERLFDMNMEYNLWLSQPSIIGWYGTSVPLNDARYILRYTNWVEIMCPVMSKYALTKCIKTFKDNITGWSIDSAWNILLGHPKNKIAIIDDIVAIHTRQVFGGDTYNNLDEANKDEINKDEAAKADSHKVREKYNIVLEMAKDEGIRLGEGEIFNAVMYSGIDRKREELPRSKRFWPANEAIESFIQRIKKSQNLI